MGLFFGDFALVERRRTSFHISQKAQNLGQIPHGVVVFGGLFVMMATRLALDMQLVCAGVRESLRSCGMLFGWVVVERRLRTCGLIVVCSASAFQPHWLGAEWELRAFGYPKAPISGYGLIITLVGQLVQVLSQDWNRFSARTWIATSWWVRNFDPD